MSYPKEILKEALNNFIVERLEKYDFKFNEKSLKFTREFGEIKNEIYFPAAKYNYANEIIQFDCYFEIESPKFKRWHKKNFPELNVAYYLNPKNKYSEKFNRDLLAAYYDFKEHEHKAIMNVIFENFENYANPYFLDNNTWNKIVDNSEDYEDKIDALIMAESFQEALELCSEKLTKYEAFMETQDFKNETNPNIIEHYSYNSNRLKIKKQFLIKTCS